MFHTRVHKIDANSQLAGRGGKGGGGEVRKWRAERRREEGTEKGKGSGRGSGKDALVPFFH